MAVCGRPLPKEDRERILRLRAINISIRKIAREVRCSPVTVLKVVHGRTGRK